jgi:hypothetical protein
MLTVDRYYQMHVALHNIPITAQNKSSGSTFFYVAVRAGGRKFMSCLKQLHISFTTGYKPVGPSERVCNNVVLPSESRHLRKIKLYSTCEQSD